MHSSDLFRMTVWPLRVVAVGALIGSGASMIGSDEWWIRIWDFPRVQFLALTTCLAVLLPFLEPRRMWWLPALLAICACWQFYRIFPYTPFAPSEVALANQEVFDGANCFTVMSYNVLQTNRDYATSLAVLEREDPDILLLMETDQAWIDAMEPALKRYPYRLNKPLDNKYGLSFATRLPMRDASVQDLAEPDTPSVFATLGSRHSFHLIGLHPRPPRPGQDTDERDMELVMAARHAKDQSIPVLAIGDFNDVAWSNTSSLFKRLGGFLDPRIGRGPFATFPANQTWLGWPLDHLFVTEEFLLGEIRVLESTGSDHRPIFARLCLAPTAAPIANDNPRAADRDDRADAVDIVDEYKEDILEDAAADR